MKKPLPPIDTLPQKPSAVIALALKDLRISEKRGHRIEMSMWVTKEVGNSDVCTVCFAGAMMANRFANQTELVLRDAEGIEVDPSALADDDLITGNDRDRLHALNEFRQGDIAEGLREMRIDASEYPELPEQIAVPDYDSADPEEFHTAMRNLAKTLEAAGL